jgi:hypothetical protein
MSKKTERKNKTNLVVNWPTTPFFTIKELIQMNAGAKEITLRVRLTKEIEAGHAMEIGCKTGGQGRPQKVFAFAPISISTFELAKAANVTIIDENRLMKLASVPSITTVPFTSPISPEPVTV